MIFPPYETSSTRPGKRVQKNELENHHFEEVNQQTIHRPWNSSPRLPAVSSLRVGPGEDPWEDDGGSFFMGVHGDISSKKRGKPYSANRLAQYTQICTWIYMDIVLWLVVWLPFFIFPYIGFLIIPIDFHIFQRGSNHQPVM